MCDNSAEKLLHFVITNFPSYQDEAEFANKQGEAAFLLYSPWPKNIPLVTLNAIGLLVFLFFFLFFKLKVVYDKLNEKMALVVKNGPLVIIRKHLFCDEFLLIRIH